MTSTHLVGSTGTDAAPVTFIGTDVGTRNATSTGQVPGPPSISDSYADLLRPLTARQRKGVIARLSVGYFEGWRPSRNEVSELVAQELRRGDPGRP